LLAVRLAFATSAERGSSIPLMLDEALSTSDPERFVAVAEALAVLAAEGRQIFYLTSNPADVAAWMGAARQDTELAPAIIDLGRIRWDQAAIKNIDEWELPDRAFVAKPDGLAPEDYAMALGVPAAYVHAPIEALHLFYLLRDDLPLLYELVEKYRIDTVGKWLSFSASGRAEGLLAPHDCKRLNAVCAGAREVQRAATVGRGKPVDEQALEESGAVSDTFMPVLRDLIHEVGGDATAMLKIIDYRVKGFRKKNRADLKEHLEGHGYIDTSPQLEISDIYARTVGVMEGIVDERLVAQDECLALVDRLVGAFGV
jgi:exonuclease SbcC